MLFFIKVNVEKGLISIKKKTLSFILQFASLQEDLRLKDLRVLLYLIPKLRKDDFIKINQTSIAEDLNINKSDVSKAIRKLIDNKILELESSESRWNNIIRLYPYDDYSIWEKIDNHLYGEIDNNDNDE